MSTSEDMTLAEDIEASVRAEAGVLKLFRTGGTVSQLVDAGARMLGLRTDPVQPVRIERVQDAMSVWVDIGVETTAQTVQVARRVQKKIEELLLERGVEPSTIHVTVVHIGESR